MLVCQWYFSIALTMCHRRKYVQYLIEMLVRLLDFLDYNKLIYLPVMMYINQTTHTRGEACHASTYNINSSIYMNKEANILS